MHYSCWLFQEIMHGNYHQKFCLEIAAVGYFWNYARIAYLEINIGNCLLHCVWIMQEQVCSYEWRSTSAPIHGGALVLLFMEEHNCSYPWRSTGAPIHFGGLVLLASEEPYRGSLSYTYTFHIHSWRGQVYDLWTWRVLLGGGAHLLASSVS